MLLVGLGTHLAGGCGGGQTRRRLLDRDNPADTPARIRQFLSAWRSHPTSVGVGNAVGIIDEQTLVGIDLRSGRRWHQHHPLSGRPYLAGSLLVGLGGGQLFALDANTGRQLWQRPAVGGLRGADDDGDITLVSIASLSGERTTMLAIDRSGRVVRQLDASGALGRAALVDGLAFVPLPRQQLLVLDLVDGIDSVRIDVGRPISHALRVGEQVFVVGKGAHEVNAEIPFDPCAWLIPPTPAGLAPAPWFPPRQYTLPAAASRYDTTRVYVQLRDRPARIAHVTRVQGPLAVGLSVPDARLRWVHTASGLVLAASTGPLAVTLCSAAGRLSWLDPSSGGERARADLGEAIIGCAVASQRAPQWARVDGPVPARVKQLRAALMAPSNTALPLQLVLLDELKSMPGKAAQQLLRELRRTPAGSGVTRKRLAAAAAEKNIPQATKHASVKCR